MLLTSLPIIDGNLFMPLYNVQLQTILGKMYQKHQGVLNVPSPVNLCRQIRFVRRRLEKRCSVAINRPNTAIVPMFIAHFHMICIDPTNGINRKTIQKIRCYLSPIESNPKFPYKE